MTRYAQTSITILLCKLTSSQCQGWDEGLKLMFLRTYRKQR